jgi:hypothetical protein
MKIGRREKEEEIPHFCRCCLAGWLVKKTALLEKRVEKVRRSIQRKNREKPSLHLLPFDPFSFFLQNECVVCSIQSLSLTHSLTLSLSLSLPKARSAPSLNANCVQGNEIEKGRTLTSFICQLAEVKKRDIRTTMARETRRRHLRSPCISDENIVQRRGERELRGTLDWTHLQSSQK